MSSVDVVVPCYRYGHFLRQCVDSVLTQSGPAVRVMIIDDASPDNSAEIASAIATKDPRVTFVRHAQNKGHIATYNEGIEWASADYFLLLSADDYLLPGALDRAVDLMDAHPEVGLTYGMAVVIDDMRATPEALLSHAPGEKTRWHIFKGQEFIEYSGSRNVVHTPTAVVRTELQKRVGGYRPELPHSGDMEMWLRFAAHASVGKVEAYQAVYRRHADNMSADYIATTWLPDLQQRKAAFEYFFQSFGHLLPNVGLIRQKLLFLLASDAIGFASMAFNDQTGEASRKMREYALEICPEIRGSLPWMKLVCKQSMGYGVWRVLRPLVGGIRKWGSRTGYSKARARRT